MEESGTTTKIDLQYADKTVCFSIASCSLDKKYSLIGLTKEEVKKLIEKLKRFEEKTWKQLAAQPRKSGLTPERKGSKSFNLVDNQNPNKDKLLEQHYFHLRIEQKGLFRIFGYQKGHVFYITHIDRKGNIHH